MWWGGSVCGREQRLFLLSLVYKQIWVGGTYSRRYEKKVDCILRWREPQIHGDPGKYLRSSSWCWGVECPTHQVGLGSILRTESACLCHGNCLKLLDYTSEHLIGPLHFLFCRFRHFCVFPGVNNSAFCMVILQVQEIVLTQKTWRSSTIQWEKKGFQKKISGISSIMVMDLNIFP